MHILRVTGVALEGTLIAGVRAADSVMMAIPKYSFKHSRIAEKLAGGDFVCGGDIPSY